jgi:predicted CoA-binding protein
MASIDPLITEFIHCRKIAIVGMSASANKFGNMAAKELKSKGYEIFPVHPHASDIDGITCYPDLKSLRDKVDAVFISIQPPIVIPLLGEIADIGIKLIWLQQGSASKEAREEIARLKLSVVVNKCILMYAPPVKSIHRLHRGINQFFGKL